MRNAAIALLLALLSAPLLSETVTNGGFEQFDSAGAPVDWQVLGNGHATAEAHSGKGAMELVRTADSPIEIGLNRGWAVDSGQQGTMLASLKGGIRFWYKVPSADKDAQIFFYVIAMSAKPLEDTGSQRAAFRVPASHFGDGRWHEGVLAYDFTDNPKAKWVHLSPRMLNAPATWILDDIEWVESVGPVLTVPRFDVLPGRDVLRAAIANAGDAPVEAPNATVSAPGVTLVPAGKSALPDVLQPAGTAYLHWRIVGPVPEGAKLAVAATGSGVAAEADCTLEPRIEAYSLQADKAVLSPGETTQVTLSARNFGPADASLVQLQLSLPPELELVGRPPLPSDVPARAWATHSFVVRAIRQTPAARIAGTVVHGSESWPVATSLTIGGANEAIYTIGDLRLGVRHSEWGAGPCRLLALYDGRWTQVGWLPHLGRITLAAGQGPGETLTFGGAAASEGGGVRFDSRVVDAEGGTWEAQASLTPGDRPDMMRVAYRVLCDKPRKILAFEGPTLLADRFGADAIFPGLEWLEGDEVSSSTLDIAESASARMRHIPHPQKITIPLMSVCDGKITTALLWDCRDPWDGHNDRPSAVFSCPGYLDGHRAATLGLLAPNALGGWMEENDVLASEPYELPAGRALTLRAQVTAIAGSRTALDAVDRWMDTYGAPEPAALPHGDYVSEVEFSARAYYESLYIPEEDAWWSSKGGGTIMSPKTVPGPQFIWYLQRASETTTDPAKGELYQRWVAKMQAKSGAKPQGPDSGLMYGTGLDWARSLLASAANLSLTQLPKGDWAFDADRQAGGVFLGYDYWDLGNAGEVELGTCSASAVQLLACARVTGSQGALEAGLKALRLMNRFRVPRAAQVWEVPMHTPDVLASAEAVTANLDAYRCTGDERWLHEAVYWARTGLPFIYLWDDPQRPFVRYASIPVLGASQNLWSWFGRPVQWNGLRYAGSLLELSEYDGSHPWRRIAEGIVRSATHQQAREGEDVALWPDSIGAWLADKSSWVFDPGMILEHVYTFLGQDPHPRTTMYNSPGGTVHITSTGTVSSPRLRGSTLNMRIALANEPSGAVLIAPIDEPTEVLLNGDPVAGGDGLPGWSYDASISTLSVRVPGGEQTELEVRGARVMRPPEPPEPVSDIAFEFNKSTEGWVALNSIANLRSEGGSLMFDATGPDPYLHRQAMDVLGAPGDVLAIRMKSTGPGGGEIYWGTESDPGYSEDRTMKLPGVGDGQWHEYRLPVGTHLGWAGQRIRSLRLDPMAFGPGEAEVDWIRLER